MFNSFITLLKKYKTATLLNIAGLAIAFASAYLILVQVTFDLSYNKRVPNADRIYRLEYPSWYNEGRYGLYWNRQMPSQFFEDEPQVEAWGAIRSYSSVYRDLSLKRDGEVTNLSLRLSASSRGGLDVFGMRAVAGSLDDFVTENDVVVSLSAARRFGIEVGDMLYVGKNAESDAATVRVVALFEDFPSASDIGSVDAFGGMEPIEKAYENEWNHTHYVRLAAGVDAGEFARIKAENLRETWRKQGMGDESIERNMKRVAPHFTALGDTYFTRNVDGYDGLAGNRSTTYTLLGIAILIVVIALINFVNFFMALVPVRIRAVNTRKIFGASRWRLARGFLAETSLMIATALAVAALAVVAVSDAGLSQYISTSTAFGDNAALCVSMVAAALAAGVAVSIYPTFYITSFSPAFVIKGSFQASRSGRLLRYLLVGVQYVISISLIVMALFIRGQHRFMMEYDMGFDNECLLTVDVSGIADQSYERRDAFSDRLKSDSRIREVAYAGGDLVALSRMGWSRGFKGEQISFQCYVVSWNFLRVLGIEMAEGRDFLSSDELRENGTFIFNERARDDFNIELSDKVPGHAGATDVAGFCRNFNFKPLQYEVEPFAFYLYGKDYWWLPAQAYIRVEAGADIASVMAYIERTVTEFLPTVDRDKLQVEFYDARLARQYEKEKRLSTLVTLFSVLSIVISLMGVFGLVMFETQYRRKEIGIRRVNGASVREILAMFNRKFVVIVSVCTALALPVSYFFVDRYLSGFAYRMAMRWWIFAVSVAVVFLITVVTVTVRSWRASNENPSNAIQR